MQKGQGSLEYLFIIAGVLAVASLVVLFLASSAAQSAEQQIISACVGAAAECQTLRLGNKNLECPNLCSRACSDPRNGLDLKTKQKIYDPDTQKLIICPPGSACGSCKVGSIQHVTQQEAVRLSQDLLLKVNEPVVLDNGYTLLFTLEPYPSDSALTLFAFTLTDLQGTKHKQGFPVETDDTLIELNQKRIIQQAAVLFDTVSPVLAMNFDAIATQQNKLILIGMITDSVTGDVLRLPKPTLYLSPFDWSKIEGACFGEDTRNCGTTMDSMVGKVAQFSPYLYFTATQATHPETGISGTRYDFSMFLSSTLLDLCIESGDRTKYPDGVALVKDYKNLNDLQKGCIDFYISENGNPFAAELFGQGTFGPAKSYLGATVAISSYRVRIVDIKGTRLGLAPVFQ
ncbi:MAG: class III signal peptide-containing protein [DPANN group archaeon]|nr:class III signal peptide-containing protein [DPANN group archaeon]